jgi:two-component system OmpR family sensor kinase
MTEPDRSTVPSDAAAKPAQPAPEPEKSTKDEDAVATGPPPARWWSRAPLRVKLVAAMLTMVAIALAVIGVASTIALRSHLLDRSDSQLKTIAHGLRLASLPRQPLTGVAVPTDYIVGLGDGQGGWTPLYRNQGLSTDALPKVGTDGAAIQEHVGEPYTLEGQDHRHRWRILVTQTADGQVLVVGQDLADVDSAVDRLIFVELLVGAAVLVAIALVGVYVVRASLKPLAEMERTAAAIAGGDLTQRVPELDPRTELGRFSLALNTMLAQIEAAFLARAASESAARESETRAVRSEERMRQFVADASHELRTPLTTIRGFAELFRQGAAEDPGDVLRRIEDEAARMGLLVEDLLLLARLDRERPLRHAPVALVDLVRDAAASAHAVAPERTVEVEFAEPTDRLVVRGDEARLRQVIGNLMTNALTHTPPGTPVTLRLGADGADHAVIEVSDSGPGLTPEQAERVFERFYRVDRARARRAAQATSGRPVLSSPHTGAGLGLAIVAALVAAHDGTVEVETEPGRGATFRVRLPLQDQ